MRRFIAAAVLAVALTGCSQSTLSADDQQFCADQDGGAVDYLRGQVDELLQDNHWSSGGEAFAFQTVTLDGADDFLSAQNVQDRELAKTRDSVTDAIFDAKLAADTGDTMDTGTLQKLRDRLNDLAEFCNENG